MRNVRGRDCTARQSVARRWYLSGAINSIWGTARSGAHVSIGGYTVRGQTSRPTWFKGYSIPNQSNECVHWINRGGGAVSSKQGHNAAPYPHHAAPYHHHAVPDPVHNASLNSKAKTDPSSNETFKRSGQTAQAFQN